MGGQPGFAGVSWQMEDAVDSGTYTDIPGVTRGQWTVTTEAPGADNPDKGGRTRPHRRRSGPGAPRGGNKDDESHEGVRQ